MGFLKKSKVAHRVKPLYFLGKKIREKRRFLWKKIEMNREDRMEMFVVD